MEEIKVIVERHPNKDAKTYHVKAAMSKKHIEAFDFPLDEEDAADLRNIGAVGSIIIVHLSTVDGIESVTIHPHRIMVIKSPVYDWEDIEADIMYALQIALKKPLRVMVSR